MLDGWHKLSKANPTPVRDAAGVASFCPTCSKGLPLLQLIRATVKIQNDSHQ